MTFARYDEAWPRFAVPTAAVFFGLWVLYVCLSALNNYGYIPGLFSENEVFNKYGCNCADPWAKGC